MITSSEIYQVSLKELGLLRISGQQCLEFLQGQLSCDVTEITPTQSRLGVHCNAKGRVLATFRIFYIAPCYYLLLPSTMVNSLLKDLSKYAPFYKVTLEDTKEAFQKTGIIGLDLEEGLAPFSTLPLEKEAVYTDQATTLLTIPSLISRVILLGPIPDEFINLKMSSKPFSYWEKIDVESGIATVYPETHALFTPHQLNCHKQGAISFTKGCYTGQEIIARMHYLGKLKPQLYKLTFNGPSLPLPGTDIVDETGKAQGTLVGAALQSDSVEQPTYQALAVIQQPMLTQPLYWGDIRIQHIQPVVD